VKFEKDGVGVEWIRGGGLWIRWDRGGLLLDAPPAAAALGEELALLRAVVLTSGRIQSVGGLLGVLAASDRWRLPELPLPVHVLLGEERAAWIAETWERGWPERTSVALDAEVPGALFDVGPFEVKTVPVSACEPDFRAGTLQAIPAVGLRLHGPIDVAWIPGAAPGPAVEHLCRDADLAVVEVGVLPWPKGGRRLRREDAIAAAAGARLLWLVGDDGERLDEAAS
jgi:hypothetical protein